MGSSADPEFDNQLAERFGVLDETSNGLPKVMSISDDNKENLIENMTLRKQRKKKRNNLKEQERQNELILEGLNFD